MIKCRLCKKTNVETIDAQIRDVKDDSIKVYKCNSCGVHFLHPYLSERQLMDFYNDNYRETYTSQNYYDVEVMKSFFNKQLIEANQRVERIKKFLNKTDDILEIGCCSGYFLYSIKEYVKNACGTEWDIKNAKYAINLGFDVRKEPTDFKKKFDKIFMFHVLEHISDPIKYLKCLKDIMNDNGMLFIEVPNNRDILLNDYEIKEFKNFYYQLAHLFYFNKSSLSYIFNKLDFEYEIINIQRYDLSNHIKWLRDKMPGGQGIYKYIFNEKLETEYKNCLIKNDKTDTLFAICWKR